MDISTDYIVIDLGEMIPTPEEEAVERAVKYGTPIGRREEFDIVPSISNTKGWDEPYAYLRGCKKRR